MATFDSELKEQRKKRLQEEYERSAFCIALHSYVTDCVTSDVAAATAAAASDNGSSLIGQDQSGKHYENSGPPPTSKENAKPSGLSAVLGLWAWRRGEGSKTELENESQQTPQAPNSSNRQP